MFLHSKKKAASKSSIRTCLCTLRLNCSPFWLHLHSLWSWSTPLSVDALLQRPWSNLSQCFRWSCRTAHLRDREQTATLHRLRTKKTKQIKLSALGEFVERLELMRSGGQWKENLPVWIWYLRSGKIQLGVTDMKWRRDLCKALMTDMAVYTTGPDTTRNINLGGGLTTCKQSRNRERGQKTYRHQTLWLLLHCKLLWFVSLCALYTWSSTDLLNSTFRMSLTWDLA